MARREPDTITEVNLEGVSLTQTFCTASRSVNTNQDGYQVPMARLKRCVCPGEAQKTAEMRTTGRAGEWGNLTRRRKSLLLTRTPCSKLWEENYEAT